MATLTAHEVDVLFVLTGARSGEVRAQRPPAPALAKDEEILLDNYRNSPPEAKAAIKATSSAFAASKQRGKNAA